MKNFNREHTKIEEERMKKIKDLIPRLSEGFPLSVYNVKLPNMPLKHFVKSYLYDSDNKF